MKIGSDNIGSLFLGADGIGKAYLGSELVYGHHTHNLPSGYKECEYVESTYYGQTAPFINTGVKGSSELRIVTKLVSEQDPDKIWPFLFGFKGPNSTPFIYGLAYDTETIRGIAFTGSSFGTDWRPHTVGPHTIDVNKYRLVFNGVEYPSSTNESWTSNVDFVIFGHNNNNVNYGEGSARCKYFYFKIYNGENLVRDYIPAYEESTGKYGLYDLVNNTFSSSGNSNRQLAGKIIRVPDGKMSLLMSRSFIADNPTLLTEWGDQWSYKHGLVLRAILMAYDNYSGITGIDVSSLLTYVKKYYHDHIGLVNGNVGIISPAATYIKTDYNSDNVQPGYNLFRLKQLDSDTTYQGYYENVIGILVDQLADQPRLVEPTSVSGTAGHPYQHKANYAYQHWLDGDFMVEPFRALYAHDRLSGQTQEDMYDDIVEQLINAAEITKDTSTQLYRHAYAGQGSSASWSENGANTPGRAYFAWGRALGWYILAICEVLDIIPSTHNPTRRSVLIGILSNLLSRLLTYRDTSGVWALLPTLATDSTNNKLEATSSCMYAYGYLHGVRMGYLSADMRDTALSVYQAVVRNFVTVNGASVTLSNCVTGGNPGATNATEADVLNNYYGKSWAANDEHGVGPFIMASLEYELLTTT